MEPADLAETVRVYGLRGWGEQSYKQCKTELGWADAMVRSDVALRRHWRLIFCAFTFCWWHWLRGTWAPAPPPETKPQPLGGKKGIATVDSVAPDLPPGPRMVNALGRAPPLLARLDRRLLTTRTAGISRLGGERQFPQWVSHPELTNYR